MVCVAQERYSGALGLKECSLKNQNAQVGSTNERVEAST